MDDIGPEEYALHERLVGAAKAVMKLYGYTTIETPPVEYFEVFAAKSGEEILTHMYAFEDAHGRKLVLRPEMTAAVARLFASKLSRRPLPQRLSYIADCYRLDDPQWGRRRRFYHAGFELIGVRDPYADVEQILVCGDFMERVGIREFTVKLGHVGVHRAVLGECGLQGDEADAVLSLIDRGQVDEALSLVKSKSADRVAAETYGELLTCAASNPRSLVEVVGGIEAAKPQLEELITVFDVLREVIGEGRLRFVPGFARGLSYYTGVIFEVYGPLANVALAGGGRYDGLIGLFGGRDFPAVGVAIGITRVFQYIVDRIGVKVSPDQPRVVVKPLTDQERFYALNVASSLRRAGVGAELAFPNRSVGEELGLAADRGVRYVVLVGPRERERSAVSVRDLMSGQQFEVDLQSVSSELVSRFGTD
ncbi:MAG: histidine--tRNA ligase [Nitrososphaerota archaeon]|nr:histidine--tRNA ligase [Nitrososphaerota archaeon]